MSKEKAGGYISKIVFNNGESVNLQRNNIIIFVGPNNAGKSQSLKDIYALSNENEPSIVHQLLRWLKILLELAIKVIVHCTRY